jgi:HSP20 family protein
MDYIKIRFGDDFDRLEQSIEGVFRSVSPMFSITQRTWTPQMDIYETPEEVVVRAEIAGVDKDNLQIEISSKAIKIFGKRTEPPCIENTTYRLAEIQYGKFERILFLPTQIDADRVTTKFEEGFLEIRLTKLPKERTHKIQIAGE